MNQLDLEHIGEQTHHVVKVWQDAWERGMKDLYGCTNIARDTSRCGARPYVYIPGQEFTRPPQVLCGGCYHEILAGLEQSAEGPSATEPQP
jgi:hypothetical protein